MSATIRAQMSRPCCLGQRLSARPWELYVAVPGCVSEWPEYTWPGRRSAIPTVAERAKALAALGWEAVPGAEWSWQEYLTEDHGHAPRVRLLAALDVRPVGGAARAAGEAARHTAGGVR